MRERLSELEATVRTLAPQIAQMNLSLDAIRAAQLTADHQLTQIASRTKLFEEIEQREQARDEERRKNIQFGIGVAAGFATIGAAAATAYHMVMGK